MGRFLRRAHQPAGPASRQRRFRLPAVGPVFGKHVSRKHVAALGAIAALGVAVQAGLPAAAARFMPATRHKAAMPAVHAQPDAALHPDIPVPVGQGGTRGTGKGTATASQDASQAGTFRQIILPDLLIVAPTGLTPAQIARLRAIRGMRNMITFDGAQITAGGRNVSVIGVNPETFRSWVPLSTASDQPFWSALSRGDFVASQQASTSLGLRPGSNYQLTGATSQIVTYAMSAKLGLSGVDLLVNQAMSVKLGLVRQVAGLLSAPGVSLTKLTKEVSAILGPSGRIEALRSQQLPVTTVAPGTQPATYLQLFQASAAQYCPGLSWTVLAAIGQIESADGTNVGPSSAGAMGPMQFLPSTWAVWGIDGFGQTGSPDILNPYDAVPSAARMLCADGAAAGGQSLYDAIFDYNHADWYVNEVLALAAEYAADYPS
jgi:hypothetical protein